VHALTARWQQGSIFYGAVCFRVFVTNGFEICFSVLLFCSFVVFLTSSSDASERESIEQFFNFSPQCAHISKPNKIKKELLPALLKQS
jgi:hypothetical protein